jgi:hypothetical protein
MAGKSTKTFEERLRENILLIPFTDCWIWAGCVDKKGYGRIGETGRKGKVVFAHRAMYMIHKGSPAGFHVCHHCDYPSCVNPKHLFLGTDADNNKDKQKKGRAAKKLNKESVIKIRELGAKGIVHKKIAEQYGVSRTMISFIIKNRSWKD